MENWLRAGYFSGSIVDSSAFLQAAKEFVVVDDAQERWFERRIERDPRWSVVRLGESEPTAGGVMAGRGWTATIWRVHRLETTVAKPR